MTEIFDRPPLPVLEQVRCYGGPVSHAALDPSHSIFRVSGIDGLISFLPTKRCSVVLGDPICAPENKAALADAFAEHCASKNSSIVYTAASADMQAYARDHGYGTMEFASLLIADPRHDPEEGHPGHHLRQHLNHARREGVIIHEYLGLTSPDTQLEAQAQAACDHWLDARHGPQMCIGRPRLFEDKPGRRWFIAKHGGIVVGVLSMLRVSPINSGNLINLVFSSPAAPLYTNELMVIAALQALRKEGADTVCLGVGPQPALGQVEGCDVFTQLLSRSLYRLAVRIMHLQGKTEFWEKFHVTRKEPLYLLFQSPRIGLREVNALLCTFQFSML